LRSTASRVGAPHPGVLGAGAGLMALAALSFSTGASLVDPRGFRIALAAALIAIVLGVGLYAPRHVLYALVVWLAALGTVRRLVSEIAPPGEADPLLLVGPAAIGVLLVVAMHTDGFRGRTSLSNAALVLALLVTAGALNPLQGNLRTGLGGLLFLLVPMLAFWVGRNLCDDSTYAAILRLVGFLAIPAAVYGFLQIFVGFPPWDADWIRESGYTSLFVFAVGVPGGTYRPFSSFSSASEYVAFLGIAVAVWVGFWVMRRRNLAISVPVVAMLGAALLYASSRGVVVGIALAVGFVLAARRRLPIGLAAVLAAALVLVVPVTARLLPSAAGDHPSTVLIAHQVQGLANPLDPDSSTLPIHLSIMREGLLSAIAEPLGIGVGAVTIAGVKFGGAARSAEADLSNVAVALGIPGVMAYLVFVGIAFSRAYKLAVARQDALALVSLGVLALTFMQWLNGGQYAVAFLPWLALGWIDRTYATHMARMRLRST
jgi:hypothetical protein